MDSVSVLLRYRFIFTVDCRIKFGNDISALSNKFVKDPREVVKAGDVVRVKVLEVDLPRQRIALTMRLTDDPAPSQKNGGVPMSNKAKQQQQRQPEPSGAMASAFAKLKR